MQTTEIFEKLIKDLGENDKKYIDCKLTEYRTLTFELYMKNVSHLPLVLELIFSDFSTRISKKLSTTDQKTFLNNILRSQIRPFIKNYQFSKKENQWKR